jgi:serine/threonine-protein phosphatase 4 regulatory subunit 1
VRWMTWRAISASPYSREVFVELAGEIFDPLVSDVSFQVRIAALEKLGPLIAELGRDHTSEALVDHFVSMARRCRLTR